MEFLDLLLPDRTQCCCDGFLVCQRPASIQLLLSTCGESAPCPLCHTPSSRVHSRYQRTLQDLPVAGYALRLLVTVRKFFCRNQSCRRRIFCERLPLVTREWGRQTKRLALALQKIGLSVGGAPGQRLTQHLAMPAGVDLLLNLARRVELPEPKQLYCVGVDDWAQRKGCRYGTILVNLETHAVLDLLTDRTAETLAAWLRKHPSIRIVSRDRASAYAQAISASLPSAIQVADRWHLLRNMTDALYKLLQANYRQIKTCHDELTKAENRELCDVEESQHLETHSEVRRRNRVAAARKLHSQGMARKDIAMHLGCHPKTVSRDLADATTCSAVRKARSSILDPYKSFLQDRVQAGCRNAAQLYREIRLQGFTGRISVVRAFLQPRRLKNSKAAVLVEKPPTPRAVAHLITRPESTLTAPETALLNRLSAENDSLATMIRLGRDFAEMVRHRRPEQLNVWLLAAKRSEIPRIRRFAVGICQDYAAVRAALNLSYSNGPTEGHINRLKCVKRQMYGRARFDLLRVRLMAA